MRLPQSQRTRRRSPGVSPAAFLAHPPDLQFWPLMDMDFATSCPLVRPMPPRIRFLFVGSRFRSTLPSDGPSRFRPCASLVLHLHQVAQGTFTPRLLDMPSTQAASRRSRWPSGRLDPRCARRLFEALRSGRRDGRPDRTTGWSFGSRRRHAQFRQAVRVCLVQNGRPLSVRSLLSPASTEGHAPSDNVLVPGRPPVHVQALSGSARCARTDARMGADDHPVRRRRRLAAAQGGALWHLRCGRWPSANLHP